MRKKDNRRIRIDLTGRRFFRLIAQWPVGRGSGIKGQITQNVGVYWLCLCDCGILKVTSQSCLIQGQSKSCGCWNIDPAKIATHGQSRKGHRSTEYNIWAGMRSRCESKKCKVYKWYGARGIYVCDQWRGEHGFENFFADMRKRPSLKYSLDRINVNGNYCPENCRWATKQEQMDNRRKFALESFHTDMLVTELQRRGVI